MGVNEPTPLLVILAPLGSSYICGSQYIEYSLMFFRCGMLAKSVFCVLRRYGSCPDLTPSFVNALLTMLALLCRLTASHIIYLINSREILNLWTWWAICGTLNYSIGEVVESARLSTNKLGENTYCRRSNGSVIVDGSTSIVSYLAVNATSRKILLTL